MIVQELLSKEYKGNGSDKDSYIESVIIEHYERYICKMCNRYRNKHYYDDLKQDLRIAILDAIRCYNSKNKAKFSTFLYSCLRNVIPRHIRYYQMVRIPEYLDWKKYKKDIISSSAVTPKGTPIDLYDFIESKKTDYSEFYHNLDVAKKYLKEEEYEQVKLLACGYPSSHVAKKFNVTPQAMRWRMKVICSKLEGKYEEVL